MTAGPRPPAEVASPRRTSLAAAAFDSVADDFDARFGPWESVAAQRRAVRRRLEEIFPPGSRILDLGGGTGEDAAHLAERGYHVLVTDPAPRMVEAARQKAVARALTDRMTVRLAAAEDLPDSVPATDGPMFDGAYSNFAALNCVEDLPSVARGLAHLLRPGARAAIVLFGPLPPGEIMIQFARRKPAAALRRLRRGAVRARIGGGQFNVWYHRPAAVQRAFRPFFHLERRHGIGIFVPPSAAEPQISRFPRLLAGLEALDRVCERPLALLGDHLLYQFRRTGVAATAPRAPCGTTSNGRGGIAP